MENRVYILRTVNENFTSRDRFRWPREIGATVTAPDWNPEPKCGGGLHGLAWGRGDLSLCNYNQWIVVSAASSDVVDIDDAKVKFRECRLEFVGTKQECANFIYALKLVDFAIPFVMLIGSDRATLTGGDYSTLTGGNRSTLTGGYGSTLTGGDSSTLTGGNRSTLTGGDSSTLTGGNRSKLTGGDSSTLTGGYGSTLTGGYHSKLTGGDSSTLTGGDSSTLTGGNRSTLTGGNRSTLTGGDSSTLTGGNRSTLTGGNNSTINGGDYSTLTWRIWDGKFYRLHTFYVGENGIEPNTPYKLVDGKPVKQ